MSMSFDDAVKQIEYNKKKTELERKYAIVNRILFYRSEIKDSLPEGEQQNEEALATYVSAAIITQAIEESG